MSHRSTSIGLAMIAALLVGAAAPSLQTPPDGAGPVQLSREQDFQRTRALLGIQTPPPAGAAGTAPETFDESKANPYPTLPDPLRLNNGQRVSTAASWQAERRPELIELFEREVYGRTPKVTPRVTWHVTSTTREMNGTVPVITRQLIGQVDNAAYPAITVNIEASVSTPANASGPVPVVLSFAAGGGPGRGRAAADAPPRPFPATSTCGIAPPPPSPPPAAPNVAPPPAAAAQAPTASQTPQPAQPPQGPTNQQQALARGWGYATLQTGSVQADNAQSLTCGIIGLVNKGQPRKVDDWGVLAAWAWGASRMLDHFTTDPTVDATQVALYGHSRWGKATLLAAVLDQRFAIAYVSSAGQGGSKLHRRKYGETVDNIANTFYYWMAGNYMKYAGRWDALPVDSHELIALMAPRPVFFSGGNEPQKNPDGTIATRVTDQGQTVVVNAYDAWIDPRGTFMAAVAAAPVYELLGRTGLGRMDFPPTDTRLVSGDLGFHQHAGGHTSGPAWETFYSFAGKYLRVRR